MLDRRRVLHCYTIARSKLLSEVNDRGHWEGELSTSALSTATAVVALQFARGASESADFDGLIHGGVRYLADHQNADGGWGDTDKSISNISTTMLAHAAFHATGCTAVYSRTVERAADYVERCGGVKAVRQRYGKDRTFSAPILTHCALAGLVDWKEVTSLPFELSCLPASFYRWARLPVVSYALPALIAIGQCRHHHRTTLNPLARLVRDMARQPSLRVLTSIQPESGGFLEATPLTAFVTMSLASMGLTDHPVTQKGVEFLVKSVRPDGSWPIDTNLATWVTTLSINALQSDVPTEAVDPLVDWLLGQQYTSRHRYTQAAPGAWAWTDLPGGVPDADDTPGALLALKHLSHTQNMDRLRDSASRGVVWLLDLQNRNGGWPTFCRGWGALPFDRSAPDLTAHAIKALNAWVLEVDPPTRRRIADAVNNGYQYLQNTQCEDGSWLPLWFGNQHCPHDENGTYGTSRVLRALHDLGWSETLAAQRGISWLVSHQNADGGWGGGHGAESTVEETAVAVEALTTQTAAVDVAARGAAWLCQQVENGTFCESAPIGFYFAKLWYYEKLYPIIFTVAALRQVCRSAVTPHPPRSVTSAHQHPSL